MNTELTDILFDTKCCNAVVGIVVILLPTASVATQTPSIGNGVFQLRMSQKRPFLLHFAQTRAIAPLTTLKL
jgi:hypothetical protein